MKRSRALLSLAIVATAATALAGCAPAAGPGASEGGESGTQPIRIGISQIVQHEALDAAREGFKKAFTDAGYVDGTDVIYDEQNAQGEQATATTIAGKFATDKVDLVLAIATPTAQAAAQAITDIPILFTAVTEPAEAGLVASWEAPGGNVTGTSDLNPVAEQIALITEVVPGAKTVGIIYSSGEVNSSVQVDMAKDAAKELGLEIKEATVTNSSEVAQAADSLKGVDAIYIPTDNRVTEGLEAVIQFSEANGVPLFGAEGGQVTRGAIATYGINYSDLGYQTGLMAIRILEEGADPASMAVETLDTLEVIINPAAAERMGVTLPASLVDRADQVIE
ncbi:ABC transporter substrate-binding protein [Microterricola viridarii]|uniref:Putative ABC transport system substrate-binding protein n=1 Tax=Microterricola viridarii TaxID=412690 RepID=A0A1H1N710_9MICO|nr:ABC transporter substrate-binding protein [Microterricola viridarii]SDR94766.1 putative ABC transport system substrate-binding protein [Microterricola viridarii]